MSQHLKAFLLDDDAGAVTVDWVVMTAAAVGFVMAVFNVVSSEVEGVAANIGDSAAAQLNGGNTTY